MAYKPKRNIIRIVFTALFFVSCFLFFGIFYSYHLFFIEQLQVFLLTFNHFVSYLSKPAFLASYLGDFLTQFYYLNGGGAAIITAVLIILWFSVRQLFIKISKKSFPELLPLIPVIFAWIALCDPEYPVSNIIGMIISVGFTLIYLSLRSPGRRILYGIIFVILLYVFTGCNFYLFTGSAIFFEIFIADNTAGKRGRILYTILLFAITVFVPLDMKNDYLLTTGQSFTWLSEMTKNPGSGHFLPIIIVLSSLLITLLPFDRLSERINSTLSQFLQSVVLCAALITGIAMTADFKMEKIFRLDYEANHNRWNKVYDLSVRYGMKNNISAYFTNMALSKLGMLPDDLMKFYQPVSTGLFIPVNANENYLTITFSNEVYWQLGDVNASQHSALLGTIFSPRAQNSRLMKRLAEINIVNGEYAAAGKFLTILMNTMFHRKWALERRKYLYNEKECSGAKWITDKRAIIPVKDLLKKGNEYVTTLRMLADSHPDNRMAVDYLLCYHLLVKDVRSFVKDFDKYYTPGLKRVLPKVYQEGLLILIASGEVNHEAYDKFGFSPQIIKDMGEYTRLYEENRGNGATLRKKFGETYWFYYHYATMKSE